MISAGANSGPHPLSQPCPFCSGAHDLEGGFNGNPSGSAPEFSTINLVGSPYCYIEDLECN